MCNSHVRKFFDTNTLYQSFQAVDKITFFFFTPKVKQDRISQTQTKWTWGERLMENILKNPLATLCVCFLKGKIKPLDEVFHFLVSFLILESPLTTLGRQSGNVTSSVVIGTHLWGHFLQHICFAPKYILKIISSQYSPGGGASGKL